jgi:hypothetical protein
LTAALIPFPTAILSAAFDHGDSFDAKVAISLYSILAGFMCLAWLLLFHVVSIHPHLLEPGVAKGFFPRERQRALVGIVLYAVAGIVGWNLRAMVALAIFLIVPIFYGITSEGLAETTLRLRRRRMIDLREADAASRNNA